MKAFLKNVWTDLQSYSWQQCFAVVFVVFVTYGMLLVNPVTAYDFNSAKGDFLQVFLTYFFMHRIMQGLIAGVFHDFTPFWTLAIGLTFLILAGMLVMLLFKRLGFGKFHSFIGVALWLSTPFFFNRSIYQHAFPAETMAFCFDALAMLGFCVLRKQDEFDKRLFVLVVLLCAISASVYQAHVNLLLTGFMGVVVLDKENRGRTVIKEWGRIVGILGASVALWFIVNHGPMLFVKLFRVVIPESGGAHDTIYWFTGDHSFVVNLKSLIVGFVLNWGYNAFFVVGLRCVCLAIVFCVALCIYRIFKRKWYEAFVLLGFALSIFVFPTIQCSVANLRTFYCFIPFIAFAGVLLLHLMPRRGLAVGVVFVCILGMAHETATLYYYNWKVKEQDKLHMSIVAHDLWKKYGLRVEKPVAIIGGWKHYPTCWEDLRPFRQLPLVNYPFTTYSNMTSANVPREFYMVAREKIGLLVPMPDLQTYVKLQSDKKLLESPAYPTAGYIFEYEGLIVVNLGVADSQWGTFHYGDYASPNEKLLERTIGLKKIDEFLMRATTMFRNLAQEYPWTVYWGQVVSGSEGITEK